MCRGVDHKFKSVSGGARGRAGEESCPVAAFADTEFECPWNHPGELPVRRLGSQDSILDWNRLKGGHYLQQALSHGSMRGCSLGCRLGL